MTLNRLVVVVLLTASAGVGAGARVVPADVYRFTTLAGSPGYGNTDGPAASARLTVGDGDIARASDGTLWFGDGHTIRQVTAAGDVVTIAGLAGAAGSVDGTGSAARFNNPRGLAVAGDGTLLVADSNNHVIRRVSAGGVVTTVAGMAGVAGASDGTGAAARFNSPQDVAVDTLGRIWVADRSNHLVRRIDTLGAVTTIAGMPRVFGNVDLAGSLARFSAPRFIAPGPDGAVYVADDSRIARVSSSGDVTRIVTMLATGMSAGHADLLYVTTPFARVERVSPLGGVETWANIPAGQTGAITSDGSGQAWLVTPETLLHLGQSGTFTRVAGVPLSGTDSGLVSFASPADLVAMSDGATVVSDTGNQALRRISATGVVSTIATFPGSGLPAGIALESGGTFVVADPGFNVIRRVTQAGVVSNIAGLEAGFLSPSDVVVGGDGTIYVTDTGNHTIRRISAGGVVSTVAGLAGTSGSTDGSGTDARFANPLSLALAGDGHLYVADAGNRMIRRVTTAGDVTTVATLTSAPRGITLAPDGSLWVTVLDGIYRVTTTGTVSPAAGALVTNPGSSVPVDGDWAVARFAGLSGITFDAAGRVLLTDTTHHRVIAGVPVSTEPAVITTQPGSQSASSGAVQLSVGVSSTMEPGYQWERSTDGGASWTAIDGATAATLVIDVARETAGAYGYRVVVDNGAGAQTSATATVTLTAAAPVFVIQPQDQHLLFAPSLGLYMPLSVYAQADGIGVTYRWERSLDGVSWSFVSTASVSGHLAVHIDHSNHRYRVVATNSAGSTTSNVARFLVSSITFQPTLIRIPVVRTASGAFIVGNARHTIQVIQSGAIVPDWRVFIAESWITATAAQGTGGATVTLDINAAGIPPTNATWFNAMLGLMVTRPLLEQPVQLAVSNLQLLFEISDDVSPIGAFDAPTDGATNVTGALPVTGWALDDVGVDRVEIWRNCVGIDFARNVCGSPLRDGGRTHVFIGNAAFIPGARPDVASQYPLMPNATRAGWGYLLLTNALPHNLAGTAEGGQGTFTLSAYAFSPQGQMTTLGAKTITLNNDAATTPFGTLDTPEQGATIPGTAPPFNNAEAYPVFGWAMTQPGKCIDTTSTTAYRVYVDGVERTLTPGVNWFPGLNRSDLAAAYPGRCNSADALAAYYLDVRTLSNGLHTIGWDVTDDGNNTSGIGSRFFNVSIGSDTPQPDAMGRDLPPAVTRTLHARIGSDDAPWQVVTRGATGQLAVSVPMGGRVVLDLGGAVRDGSRPAGSTLVAEDGRFYWIPPVGFLGTFPLWFTGDDGRIDVVITWVR